MRLRRIVGLTTVITLLAGQQPRALAAQNPESPAQTPEVRTQATARRAIRPNLATLTVQLSALGVSPREAGGRVAARADSVRRAVQALGIPRDSVWTSNAMGWYWQGRVDVVAGQQVWHNPPPGVAGKAYVTQDTAYRARDVLEIRVSDLRKVGPVIDTLLALGITEMTGPRFLATATAEAREGALRDATRLARQQAETMAEASGMRLGSLLTLNSAPEYGEELGIVGATAGGIALQARGGPPTSVVEPTVQVSVTVIGRWRVVPK